MTDAEKDALDIQADLRSLAYYEGDVLARAALKLIEALTKERDAARQDAKAAEDELEMQEQEASMMEDDYIKLEKERDALEAKLAKAVKLIDLAVELAKWDRAPKLRDDMIDFTTEIKGENHDPL